MLASIIIPSLGRGEALDECLWSISNQSYQNFEIITVTEDGPLATIRNAGAKLAAGDILIFIDDDVVCEPRWLEAIIWAFKSREVDGVSGPSYTVGRYRKNRDVFRYQWLESLFCDRRPGHFSLFGAASLAATSQNCDYQGEVEYLEACNMAFSKKAFWSVNGFDEQFLGIGEWCEPDICFRIRQAGGKLWFARNARVEHRPSQSGAYKKRLRHSYRMENYELLSKRWFKQNLQHSFYKFLIRNYYRIKESGNGGSK